MSAHGFNPMRWDCSKRGCFNIKKRLKFEVFYDLLKGSVSFSDVDGIVEINSRALILEWKDAPVDISIGQYKMFERITKGQLITVYCVAGNPEFMSVSHLAMFVNGEWKPWEQCTLEKLRAKIAAFRRWAGVNPGIWPNK